LHHGSWDMHLDNSMHVKKNVNWSK
jgi:hypothetical protein